MKANTTGGWGATRRGDWLMGCGIALAVTLLLLIATIVIVRMNWRSWSAKGMDTAFTKMIAEMPLDEAQRTRTQAVADDFIERFRDGDIGVREMGRVVQELTESPVLPAGIAMSVGRSYLVTSGLDQTEQAEANVQLRRIANGLVDKSIDPAELRTVFEPLRADPGEPDSIQFNLNGQNLRIKSPSSATDEDLRALIERSREVADRHGVPPDAPEVDFATELDRAIRRALGEPIPDDSAGGAIEVPVEPAGDEQP